MPAVDAQFFDAAPFACPAIGIAPQFSRLLHQDVVQPFREYTISATTAWAMAYDTRMASVVEGQSTAS